MSSPSFFVRVRVPCALRAHGPPASELHTTAPYGREESAADAIPTVLAAAEIRRRIARLERIGFEALLARRRLLDALVVRPGRGLPILAVEGADLGGRQIDALHAADIESPAARVEPGTNERVDSAMPAEVVLRRLRIELIKGEIGLAGEHAEVRVRRRVPEGAYSATDRAVAIDDVVGLGSNLERDPATMARAPVGLDHPGRYCSSTVRARSTYSCFCPTGAT